MCLCDSFVIDWVCMCGAMAWGNARGGDTVLAWGMYEWVCWVDLECGLLLLLVDEWLMMTM